MVQQKKVEMVETILDRVQKSKAAVFVDFRGLTVAEANALRAAFREADVDYHVVKNRLARRAYDQTEAQPPDEVLQGPTGIAFALTEATAPAKVLSDFKKSSAHVQVKGAFIGVNWIDAEGVEKLAKIPSREILLSRLAGSLQSPLANLASLLKQLGGQRLATALKAVADQKTS